jgi:endonuclease YncB( thermonuclease family)
MLAVVDRLKTAAVIAETDNIRRDHRTVVPREKAPAVHVIDGDETPQKTATSCYCKDELDFTVSIFVRDDEGYQAADPIKLAVMAALDPTVAYGNAIELRRGRIRSESEIADGDSLRVDMEFQFCFQTAEWAL